MARMRTLRIPYFGSIIMEPHNRMFSVSRHEARSRRNGATAALHRITTHYFRMINWQRTRIRINGSDHARKMKCLPARIQAKYVISRCWPDVKKKKKNWRINVTILIQVWRISNQLCMLITNVEKEINYRECLCMNLDNCCIDL